MTISDQNQPLDSFTTTLREKGGVTVSSPYQNTIPASSSISTTVSVRKPTGSADSLRRVKVSGTGVANIDNYWYAFDGYVRPNAPTGATSYLISITNYSDGTNENFVFTFQNNTGAPVILPTLTLSARCRFYDAPWEVN